MYTELKTYQIIIALLHIAFCLQAVAMFRLFTQLKKTLIFIAIQ